MTTTTLPLSPGSRVCRRSCRNKIVGTVISIGSTHARVKWERSRAGLVRLSNGMGQSSSVRLSDLVREAEFVYRPLSQPPEDAWRPTKVDVMMHDDSGVWETGRNWFTYEPLDEAKAVEQGKALAAAGKRVVVQRQEKAEWVPEGCRAARVKYRWIELFRS